MGTDYPILSEVQDTAFSCQGRVQGGYYADTEADCQQYNVCLQDPVDTLTLSTVSFLCPNGTIFNQELFVCDWWFNVDCTSAPGFYSLSEGAFGTSGLQSADAGTCSAADILSPDYCQGAVSNCWSPGQRDADCPNYGLCCFDGCADTCVGEPEVQAAALAPAVEVTATTEGYKYEAPEVTLPIRPVTTLPPALYGPPQQKRTARRRLGRKVGRKVESIEDI